MAIERDKSFEISEDGLQFEAGVHVSSGVDVPTHAGVEGDLYFRTNGEDYKFTLGVWTLQVASSGVTDNVDGGFSNSNYLSSQIIDGMGA